MGNRLYYRGLRAEPKGLALHFNYAVGVEIKRKLTMERGAWYVAHTRSAAWRARVRYLMVTAELRSGLWLAPSDVGVDLDGDVLRVRRRLLEATRKPRWRT